MTSTISAPSQANMVVAGFAKVSSKKITHYLVDLKGSRSWQSPSMARNKCPVFPTDVVTFKTAYLKFFLNTVLVKFLWTDIATQPSQCWCTRLARRIPKNNIERGRGARKGHFRLGCEVSQLNLSKTVVTAWFTAHVPLSITFSFSFWRFFRSFFSFCFECLNS